MARVLVVDDDEGLRESAALALEKVGHRVFCAADVHEARAALRAHAVDVVVSDIYMPGEDGLALLEPTGARRRPAVILMTARGTIETATMARLGGAFAYLAKPFDLAELIERVNAATAKRAVVESAPEPEPSSMIVGSHPLMVAMYNAITRVAALPYPVLLLGESGTGKELVAQALHRFSPRCDAPFVAIHCGAIPDTLLENELFGSMRGAYTDSRHDRRGALLRADGGTVLLDEIGDVSPAFQVKLLRFLQDGIVAPLGSEKTFRVTVRVVAATHRDLRQLVRSGRFREDLYFRLAAYEIAVPPLRDRAADIPLLVDHFKRQVAAEIGLGAVAGPTGEVLEVLAAEPWPGNVRQLQQVIRRVLIDERALVDAAAVRRVLRRLEPAEECAAPAVADVAPAPELTSLDEAERKHIAAVLRATSGNQTQAAYILGIERKTLARKLKRYGIRPNDLEAP